MEEIKIVQVIKEEKIGGYIEDFYGFGYDGKMYKWDYQTGEWRPFCLESRNGNNRHQT